IVEATARAIAAAIERTAGVQAALLRAALLRALLAALLRAALLLPTGLRVLLRLLILLRLPRLTLLGGLTLLPRLPRLTGRRERGLTRVERPRLPRQLVELAPQRLQLRDQLGIRIGLDPLALHGLFLSTSERLLRLPLEVAQRGRRDRVGGRDLHAVPLADQLGGDGEEPLRLGLLQAAQRVRKLRRRTGRLIAELLRDPLDVARQLLERPTQIVLALGELVGLLTVHAAAQSAAVDAVVQELAHPLLQLRLKLALLPIEVGRTVREIGERLARSLLPLRGHLLQRGLKLTPGLLDRPLRFGRIDAFALPARPIHRLERLVEL